MPQRRTGTVQRYIEPKSGEEAGHYVVRCSAPDGSRPLFHLDPSPKSSKAEAEARKLAGEITERLWATGLAATPKRGRGAALIEPAGTGREWWARYLDYREQRGLTSVGGTYRKHILPVLDLAWEAVERSHCELLRDALDAKVERGDIEPKTAFNAWAVFRTAAKTAAGRWSKDKRRTLAVRNDDPSEGVIGPDYDPADTKQLQWLYPREVLAIASCEAVPLDVRRRIVLSTYLCVRAGELKALTWDKLDLERGVVIVNQAYSREKKRVKSTKSGARGSRRYSVEAEALPLLRALRDEADGPNVVSMSPQKRWAPEVREALEAAGVARPELTQTTAHSKQLRFHDLRATGLTWMALRGDSPVQIQHVAGHTDFKTTKKYIDAAGTVDLLPGEVVFPPLPDCLVTTLLSQKLSQIAQVPEIMVEAPGIEPGAKIQKQRKNSCFRHDAPSEELSQGDRKCLKSRTPVTACDSFLDPIETALAEALTRATEAREWATVRALAEELKARREARMGVVDLGVERVRRGK